MSREDLVAMVPACLALPSRYTDATITVGIQVDADGLVVSAPALAHLVSVLPAGSITLVEQFCSMWSQWLARNREGVPA